jgi:hypothetical protein
MRKTVVRVLMSAYALLLFFSTAATARKQYMPKTIPTNLIFGVDIVTGMA